MTTTTVNDPGAASAPMTPTERRLFRVLAQGLGHTPASLFADPATAAGLCRTARILGQHVREDLNDQLAELLYDAGHDACDDQCIGGGRL
jgi:hypothetical protein